jgi:cell division protein FtsQ
MLSDTYAINRFALWVGLASIAAIAWSAFVWANGKGAFALRQVSVISTPTELDPGLLESAIRSDLRGTFFTLSPHRARNTLKKLPWVRDAVVSRRWPLAVDVRIEEYKAVGYWGDSDLLSDKGEVFRASSRAPMPRFDGPVAASTEVLSRYRETKLALAPLGLEIKSLTMSPRGAIAIQVRRDGRGELSVELGKENFEQRLNRFVSLYGGWSPAERAAIARVDLRYKFAVAVGRNANAPAAFSTLFSDTAQGEAL